MRAGRSWFRRGSVAVTTVVGCVGGLLVSVPPSVPAVAVSRPVLASESVPVHPSPGVAVHPVGANSAPVEVPGLRTATSKTYEVGQGRETVLYPGPVNYEDPSGAWQPIDDALVADTTSGFAWKNTANSFSAEFPSDASSPVRTTVGDGWIGIGLAGAAGMGTVSGSTVSYPNVASGLSESFTAQNQGVDAAVAGTSATALSSVDYDVTTSTGVNPSQATDGTITVTGLGSSVVFGVPSMTDAAGASSSAVTMSLSGDATSGYVITETPDTTWVAATGRVFPVTVDPPLKVTAGGSLDPACTLNQGSPTTSACTATSTNVGYNGTNAQRSILQFNDLYSAGLSYDSQVESAELSMYANAASSGTVASVGLYPVTSAWTTSGTWNTKNGTTNWGSAGGDFSSTPTWTTSVGAASTTYKWELTALVQSWVSEAATNDGILLKQTTESTNNMVSFTSWQSTSSSQWPTLTVYYTQGWGSNPAYTTDSIPLTDRSSLDVNVASGNVMLTNNDIDIAGNGLDLGWESYYNSLASDMYDESGYGWSFSSGNDVKLHLYPDAVSLQEPGGSHGDIFDLVSGAWVARGGVNATLTHSGSTWTVSFDGTQTWTFTVFSSDPNNAYLTSMTDRSGDTVSITYDSSDTMHTITDTRGRTVTFGWDPTTYALTSVTESTGRAVYYGYNSSLQLTSYEDANGNTSYYAYDAYNNLTQITDPDGHIITLAYGSAPWNHQVSTVTQVSDTTNTAGPTTYFSTGWNTGTVPPVGYAYTTLDSATTSYHFDTDDQVTATYNPFGWSAAATYNADNEPTSTTDALNNTSTTTYSSSQPADPTAAAAPSSNGTNTPATDTATYNTPSTVTGYQWLPSSTIDAEGNCTAYVYDPAGNVTDTYAGQAAPCDGDTGGIHTATRYQGDTGVTSCGGTTGEVCSTINGNGNTTTYGYDSTGEQTTITPPSPLHATTITYDAESRPATVTDGNGKRTYTYDNDDRVTQILYGGATTCTPSTGDCITYTYDADGNKTQMVDNTGTTTWAYNNIGQLTKEIPSNASTNTCSSPNDAGITYAYDDSGNLITMCDSAGTTGYGYDLAGNLVATGTPIEQVGTTSTSGTGSSLTVTLPREIASNDQTIISVTTPSTVTVTTPSGYTLVGTYSSGTGGVTETILRRTASTSDYQVTISLSGSAHATAVAGVYRGVSTSSPIDVSSHNGANSTTSTTISGVTTTAPGDKLLLAEGATGTFSTGSNFTTPVTMNPDTVALAQTNTSGGLASQWLAATGASGSRTLGFGSSVNLEGVLIALKPANTTAAPTLYAYNDDGDRTSTNYPDGVSQNMTYNDAGELTGINAVNNNTSTTLANYTYTWASGANDYDQRQSVTESVAGTTYAYTYDAYNRLTRAQETAGGTNNYQYTYDNDGNPLTQNLNSTTTTNTYNTADQACWTYTGTTTNTCSSTPTGATTYSYDSTGNGNLTATSTGFSASYNTKNQTTSITPAGGSATAMTYAGGGQSTRTGAGSTSFVNDGEGIASSTVSGAITSYTTEPSGTLTSITSGGATYYYLCDGENNVIGLVDSSGARQATYSYDPYGNTTSSGTDASLNPYRYQGGYQDSTGLYHFGDRYYQPTIGQWTQLDPTVQDPGYVYAGNDPIDNSDPSGDAAFCSGRGYNPNQIIRIFTRRTVAGGHVTATLTCGNTNYGYRHILAGNHFGGVLNTDAYTAIGIALMAKTNDVVGDYTTYTQGEACYEGYNPIYIFTVRVVVNWTTNNIVTAYLLGAADKVPLTCT